MLSMMVVGQKAVLVAGCTPDALAQHKRLQVAAGTIQRCPRIPRRRSGRTVAGAASPGDEAGDALELVVAAAAYPAVSNLGAAVLPTATDMGPVPYG